MLVQRGVGSLFRRRRALALALGGLSAIALGIFGVLAGSLPYQLLSLLLQVFCAGTTLFGGRRTSAGEERLRRLLGLRRYLRRADSASLQRLTLQDPQYFYRMLPFAEEMGVGGRFVRCAGRSGAGALPLAGGRGPAPRRDFFAGMPPSAPSARRGRQSVCRSAPPGSAARSPYGLPSCAAAPHAAVCRAGAAAAADAPAPQRGV